MKKIVSILAVALSVLFISSCSTVRPVAGVTGIVGSKTGEASQSFLGDFPLKGEGGIFQAAKNGGITKVGTVDIRIDWPCKSFNSLCDCNNSCIWRVVFVKHFRRIFGSKSNRF